MHTQRNGKIQNSLNMSDTTHSNIIGLYMMMEDRGSDHIYIYCLADHTIFHSIVFQYHELVFIHCYVNLACIANWLIVSE